MSNRNRPPNRAHAAPIEQPPTSVIRVTWLTLSNVHTIASNPTAPNRLASAQTTADPEQRLAQLEHVHRAIQADHAIATRVQHPTQMAGAAAQIEDSCRRLDAG